jgi:hypothetical protein
MIAKSSDWIFAHRGLWTDKTDQNSRLAISNAFGTDFAIETDFRDVFGDMVISHDPPVSDEVLRFDEKWSRFRIAYNLKSDGLSAHFRDLIPNMVATRSFAFDGSLPEMLKFRNSGIPHALRLSEFEKELPWDAPFIWVDGFAGEWWMGDPIILSLLQRKHLVFVSPELHGRDYRRAFNWFSELRSSGYLNFSVCTDKPFELREMNE